MTYVNQGFAKESPSIVKNNNHLYIHTLGQFSVYRGDVLLTAKSGRLNKPWELFMYLVTNRDKLLPAELIQEELWPDSECMDPVKYLKNQVHRLRNMVDPGCKTKSSSVIMYSRGSYCWNSSISCWLDVELFETLCNEARDLVEEDPTQAASKYREAIELYRGDYLPEFTRSEWLIPVRQYYRKLYLRSVLELLDICKKAQNHSDIAEICEKTFIIDQFEEELHMYYLEALLKEGKITQAREHYQYITALLYREFGAKPSGEMQRLYRSIKGERDNQELDFGDFRELLLDRQDVEGALQCDTASFELICRKEKRWAKRANKSLFVATLTLTSPDYRLPPPVELQVSIEVLKGILLFNLRHGDVFSQWNESQFVMLLSEMNLEQAETVLQRITRQFKKKSSNSMVIPRSSLHPLFSAEKN